MSEKRALGSIRDRVARALYGNTGAQITPWEDISSERKAGWLSDADLVIPIVAEACARVPDQRDPEKPGDYLFPRERIGNVIRGLFIGDSDGDVA
jgi:hypothetical protein